MAVSRSVSVTLSAKVNQYKADMAAAGKSAVDAAQKTETAWDKSSTRAGKAMDTVSRYSSEMTTAGTAMAGFGAVVVGSLGLATKASMSWESAWTGVLKTVDGTPKQLAAVEDGLRGLAKELPATHEEIAAVAEAAGQLGIKTDNVVSFTKTMINMGEATNLSAEEAATSLARLANIMGTSQNDFGKMGAAIVGLGNNFATTESEIVDMSMRVAAVGKQAGLTEGEVFGLATALSSVGIRAEAGGTAMTMVMKKITKAVGEGGEGLDEFARISGMSSEQFAQAWQQDAAGALSTFVAGLGEADASGENVNNTLSELGITGIRESDALLRLAGASDVLTEALKQGNDEFDKGTALAEEAAKRYETAESRIKIAGNSLKDTAITIGGTFLPAMAEAADAVAGFADIIGKLPEPVIKAGAAVAGIAGAATLAGGAALILAPRIAETVTAFGTLRAASLRSTGPLGKVGKNLGRVGRFAKGAALGLTAVALAGDPLSKWGNSVVTATGETADALQELAGQMAQGSIEVDSLNESFSDLVYATDDVGAFGNAVQQVIDPNGWGVLSDVATDTARVISLGMVDMTSSTEEVRARFESLGEQLATMHADDAPKAAEAFGQMVDATDGSKESIANLIDLMPAFKDQLIKQAQAMELGTDNATLAQIALDGIEGPAGTAEEAIDGVGGAAEDASQGLQGMLEDLLALGIIQQTEMESMASYEEAIDGISEAVEENGRTLDITTEKGRANQDALFAIADAGRDAATAMAENGASQEDLQGQLQRTYDDLVGSAQKLGLNEKKAKDMAREIMGIPEDVSVESWMDDAARKEADKTKDAVDGIDKDVQINVHFNVTEPKNGIKNMPENLLNPNRNRSKSPGSVGRYDFHDGGVITPMAAGGFTGAEMVKPNSWRVVGDRMDVDEAYIPLDGSQRSMSILMEAIQRMPGFGGAMADGGVTGIGGGAEGEAGAVGGVPVPDTAPITEAWQAMFDQMLTTTVEGWAAQVAQQALSQETLLLGAQVHLSTQAAMLQADYATQLSMQQAHNASQLTLAQGQWAAMNAAVLAALNLQNQQVKTGFTTQHNTMSDILGLMGQTVVNRWSDMSNSQDSHLGAMQSNASTGFNAIRSGGEQQMSALSTAVAREMGELPPETRSAMEDTANILNKFADAVNESFGEIGVTLPQIPAFRDGGPINGPGTGTSDSILARVSNGEFIMPADRTSSYYPILEAMRSGDYPAYATGGMVDLENAANWLQGQNVRISEFGAWGQRVGGHANGSYHYRPPGQAFDANYGPGGQNAIETAKFNQLVPMINSMWPALRTLWGVAGHANHLHVDTGGGGAASGAMGGLLGALDGAMPADMGDAYAQAAKKVGGDLVKKFSGQLPDNPMANSMGSGIMSQAIEGLIKQSRDFGDSFAEGSGEAGGVERWRSTVMAALQRVGLPTNDAYVEAWLRQIMSESGGNPGITQGVSDVNSGGNEAVGLVQVIPGTFAAYRDKDLPNDRRNPLANLVAGMNWANYKYGRDHLDVIGHGHGYANGTMSAERGWTMVGEEGPEMMWLSGGEKIANAATTRATLGNNRMYQSNTGRGFDATAIGHTLAAEINRNQANPTELAKALDGLSLTLMVGDKPMSAYISSQVGSIAVGAGRAH